VEKSENIYGELPPLQINFRGVVLGCDPSLANFGWTLIDSRKSLDPVACGCFEALTALEGNDAVLKRAEDLYGILSGWLEGTPCDVIAYEMPAARNLVQRPESALLAASSLRLAAKACGRPLSMVSANRAKLLVAGYSRADKKRVRNAIRERFPHLRMRMNEHMLDAYAIGLTYIQEPTGKP
jgi:Holliday junction resolvasome RuvABC endonuclease subunit